MLPMTYYSGSQFSVYHGDGGGRVATLPRGHEDPYAIPQQQQMPYLPPVDYCLPPPAMYEQPPDAVECRGLMKTYGRGKGKTKALNNVNMNVEQGSIYGLLGPSGCGKTTLLSCIVGRLRPDAGTIRVFGQKPGHKDSGVPGSLIGYMPQDIALYQQFSIEETLKYFGRLHGMPMSDIKHRSQFLVRFLGLPNTSRMVENLSGGQQRRVSLAVALLQKPKLLILDEPTVGVDPLLRYSIWQHLVNLARDEGTSVVITTHYIEEARQANRVGLMRNGALLAQASPESLLIAHRLPTLEDVFLKLCQSVDGLQKTRPGGEQQGVGFLAAQRQKQLEYAQASGQLRHGGNQMSQVSDSWALVQNRDRTTSGSSDESTEEGTSTTRNGSGSNRPTSMPNGNVKARIGKMNGEATYDNPIFTLTGNGAGNGDAIGKKSRRPENMVSGASQLDSKFGNQGLFHGGIDPHPIKTRAKRGRSYVPTMSTMRALIIKNFISMFRHYGALAFEIFLPPFQIVLFCLTLNSDPKGLGLAIFNAEVNYTSPFNATCDSLMYSCNLFKRLGSRKEILAPKYYPSLDEANEAVLNGDAWGSVHIKQDFSLAIIDRGLLGLEVSNETIDDSRIDVRLDMTNQQVAFIMQREIMFGFQEFFEDTLIDHGHNPMLASVPVNFAEPIYGVKEPLYTEFVAPGMLVMITFFMALGLTAMAFVLERKQGLIYRSYVAGVKNVEVLVCYMITQICVLVIQIALTLIVMLLAFEVPNRGSVWIISILCFMQGICGMSFGLVISALFNDETSTIVACLGIFLPCLLLSGMCWPREGMMPFLHYISAILPQTFGTDALRAVMSKGNDLSQYAVYMGLVIPGAWTVFQMCVSSLFVHLKEGF